jgi:hypothetical protein
MLTDKGYAMAFTMEGPAEGVGPITHDITEVSGEDVPCYEVKLISKTIVLRVYPGDVVTAYSHKSYIENGVTRVKGYDVDMRRGDDGLRTIVVMDV